VLVGQAGRRALRPVASVWAQIGVGSSPVHCEEGNLWRKDAIGLPSASPGDMTRWVHQGDGKYNEA
jgi:hypothetical protein